jgi:electron transfer flavoprotein alpha subunit
MTGDCVGVDIAKAGRLLQQKPAYGGNIVSVIMGATSPQLASVRARMYDPLEARPGTGGEVERFAADGRAEVRARFVEHGAAEPAGYALDEADVVVCVGAGVGGADSVAEIEAIAGGDAAVGGTHELCGLGWLPWGRDLGLYGRTVAPRLLVAVGVAGEFWETTGWVKADVVVAVNAGVTAGMDETSDVVLAGDWREALPALLAAVAL